MSQTTDAKVIELFNLVREKQKLVKNDERQVFHTHCSFSTDPNSTKELRRNLHTIQSVEELVDIYAFLVRKESDLSLAAKELGLSIKMKHMDFTIDAWKSDIKTRLKQLDVSNEKKKLQKLESQLDALISVEQRREMELEAISKELNL